MYIVGELIIIEQNSTDRLGKNLNLFYSRSFHIQEDTMVIYFCYDAMFLLIHLLIQLIIHFMGFININDTYVTLAV